MTQKTNILIFGAPGSGKGTQAQILRKSLGVDHISTGDLVRDHIKRKTPLGEEIKTITEKGGLVPDDMMLSLFKEKFSGVNGGFILDGFPRTLPQAEALESLMKELEKNISKVVYLHVPSEELMGRLVGRRVCDNCGQNYHIEHSPSTKGDICDKCGGHLIQRKDDEEERIRHRLNEYENKTKPLLEFYKKRGCLEEINGQGEVSEVAEKIEKTIL